jgi:hypothetical protein
LIWVLRNQGSAQVGDHRWHCTTASKLLTAE